MQDKVRVELLRQLTQDDQPQRWQARIGDALFPVAGFELGLTEDGTPVMVLTVPASGISVDEASEPTVEPTLRPAVPNQPRSYWGNGKADPRENIPGWVPDPSLAQQVADNAEANHG